MIHGKGRASDGYRSPAVHMADTAYGVLTVGEQGEATDEESYPLESSTPSYADELGPDRQILTRPSRGHTCEDEPWESSSMTSS